MKKISVVIPCYNEEAVLSPLFKRLTAAAKKWHYSWEVICVDDGSRDKTLKMLQTQHKKDKHWKVIALSRNFGHQMAISCGINYANGDAVIVMDADLQDPPEELHRFISKWESGYDVVYAIRQKRKEGAIKKFSYWLFYRVLAKLVTFEIPLDSGDFSIMDKRVADVIKKMPERRRFVRGLRAWSGFKQIGIKYERAARLAGETKYPFNKLLGLAIDGIFSFSAVPLTIASYLGIWISIIALLGILFTLLQRIFKDVFSNIGIGPVPGYATIVIAILFLGGVQLIFLGIIGNYLGRMYDEIKNRPAWIVKESYGIHE